MMRAEQAYLTTDRVLEHTSFASARDIYIDAVLALYETKQPLIELMLDGGRIMVYGIIMALWGGYREDDAATLPTISRLKQIIGWFNVASPRQIDHIVARFAQAGHLRITPVQQDLRMRVVLPSQSLIEHDRAFIRAHYVALAALVGRERYVLPLSGDLDFLKAMREAWIATLGTMAREIFTADCPIQRFYAGSAGVLMLMKLVQLQHRAQDGWIEVDYTDFGRRFGVSRTHVRTLFKSAVAAGHMEVNARSALRVMPALAAALDRNIAGRLSLLDRALSAAIVQLPERSIA